MDMYISPHQTILLVATKMESMSFLRIDFPLSHVVLRYHAGIYTV
jgi:hypothetical protein